MDKLAIIVSVLLASLPSYAAIDPRKDYDVDPPFLGWESSFCCAFGAVVCLILLGLISKLPDFKGQMFLVLFIGFCMLVFALFSAYLLFILGFIFVVFVSIRDRKK